MSSRAGDRSICRAHQKPQELDSKAWMSKQSPIEKLLELGLLDPKLFDVEPLPIVDGEFVCAFGGCWFGFYCVEHQLAATVSLVMLIISVLVLGLTAGLDKNLQRI